MLIGNYEISSDRLREIIERYTAIDEAELKDIICIYGDRSHCGRSCVCYSETEPVSIGHQTLIFWTCTRCGVTRYRRVGNQPSGVNL